MGLLRGYSLGTHVLIAAGLLVGVVVFAVGSNWSTFVVMYENLAAMNEGQRVAEQMRQPSDLLEYIATHPDNASLVAYEVGVRENGIFFEPDRSRPVVQVQNLLLLAEYARKLDRGELTASERVPVDSIGMYALPGAGQSHHQRAVRQWVDNNLVFADSTVALGTVVQAMVDHGDPGATDWLMTRFGRPTVQDLPRRWGLSSSDPPLPRSGLHLRWAARDNRNGRAVDQQAVRSENEYRDRVYRRVLALRRDSSYRQSVRTRLERQGLGLSVRDQKRLARTTYPKGTARNYADFAARIADGTIGGPRTARRIQNYLESSIETDSIQTPITSLVTQVGAMPGLISFVAVAETASGQSSRVSVLLFENLPIGLFYHIVQTELDKGLQLRLLSDPEFFDRARTLLSPDTASASP